MDIGYHPRSIGRRASDHGDMTIAVPPPGMTCRRVGPACRRKARDEQPRIIPRREGESPNGETIRESTYVGDQVQRGTREKVSDLVIAATDPHSLGEEDYMKIHEITQDMWARGLGEFLECPSCSYIASKSDIFGGGKLGVVLRQYRKSVKEIMNELNVSSFECPHCSDKMELIYGDHYLDEIKDRLQNTESYLVLARMRGEIIGYMDFFATDIAGAYRRDWARHYSEIGLQKIESGVQNLLGTIPERVFCFTAMGLLERYSNLMIIFKILHTACLSVEPNKRGLPCISELDKNNTSLYRFYTEHMGGRSLGLSGGQDHSGKIVHTHANYQSDIVVSEQGIENFLETASLGFQQFATASSSGLKAS